MASPVNSITSMVYDSSWITLSRTNLKFANVEGISSSQLVNFPILAFSPIDAVLGVRQYSLGSNFFDPSNPPFGLHVNNTEKESGALPGLAESFADWDPATSTATLHNGFSFSTIFISSGNVTAFNLVFEEEAESSSGASTILSAIQKHCPAFGATASFSALPNQVTFGDNHTQRSLKGINALKMSLSLQFNELKDDEAKELINYLKNISKYSIQNYDSAGKFDNKRIEAFDYQPFYPYKKNKFYCLNFSHEKPHYNINNINATLECAVPSILSSIESFAGHNSNIDCLINANIGSASTAQHNAAQLSSGDLIYQSGNYVNAKLTDAFTAIPDSGPDDLLITSEFNFVDQNISSNQTSKRHSIFINNPNECFYYPYNPIYKHGTLDVRMFDFRASQSITINNSPKTRQSNINDFYKKNNKYGFNEDLLSLNLQFNSRSDIEAKRILLFLESHLGYKKFGFHLSKDYFADADDGSSIINSRKSPLGFFYCPTWSHNYIYKDNHNISVNFIECLDY